MILIVACLGLDVGWKKRKFANFNHGRSMKLRSVYGMHGGREVVKRPWPSSQISTFQGYWPAQV